MSTHLTNLTEFAERTVLNGEQPSEFGGFRRGIAGVCRNSLSQPGSFKHRYFVVGSDCEANFLQK